MPDMPFRNQNEDLFEDSRMSFGEHLEELRKVLIRSLIGIAIGCLFGFMAAERVVSILQVPLENALTKYYVELGKQELRTEHGYLAPELSRLLDGEQKIPETVLVDPIQLIDGLRTISPDFMESVPRQTSRFAAKNFDPAQVPATCRIWSAQNAADGQTGEQWQLLWNLLDESDRDRINRIGAVEKVEDADLRSLAAIMNRLLPRDEIHQSDLFKPLINTSDRAVSDLLAEEKPQAVQEMKQQLAQQYDADLSQRINRQLISSLFGSAISDVQLDMIPLTIWKSARYQSQSLGATEPFMIWIKAGTITGLILASPWVFYQLWTFVAAGLYPTEQRSVYVFLPISLLLFLAGVLLAFFFVFEPVLDFLFSFNASMGISPHPRINDWLSFVMFLPLGFGIAFQLPLIMVFANRIELISVAAYMGKWRIAIVAIFGISMILTPADPISMILLAVPLTGLYFLGILMCRWFNKPANPYVHAVQD